MHMETSPDRKILYLGRFYPRTLLSTVNSDCRGRIVFSNHNFEMSLLSGFISNGADMRVVTVPNVASYPFKNRRLFTRGERYSMDGVEVVSAGFCNIWPLFRMFQGMAARRCIRRLWKEEPFTDIVINAPVLSIQKSVEHFRKKGVRITAIYPDIPQVMTSMGNYSPLRRLYNRITNRRSIQLADRYNHYVLLTDSMKGFFHPGIDYIVMEGVVNEDFTPVPAALPKEREVVAYTGSVNRCFGVMNLVEAFEMMDYSGAELWICGSGDCEGALREAALRNPSIRYFGLVNPSEAKRIQREASVLVNPRTSEGEFTRYSFPSKTLEYLSSGHPVVANPLEGIPGEYMEHLVVPADESPAALSLAISKALSLPESTLKEMSASNMRFIMTKKASFQTRRILEMIFR